MTNEEKTAEEIRNIKDQLIEKYKPQQIILFGSAAKESLAADSDLDFLLIKDDVPQKHTERMRQVRALIRKNMAADFLVYRRDEYERRIRMGDPFLRQVASEGKVIYG